MKTVARVLARDIKRLLTTPAALVVTLALLILPSAYTWYNVIGFWNPYDNTGSMRVCVVNEDAGGSSEATGELVVGDQIVDELSQNTQLAWTFTDRATALDEVAAGTSYAAFIIPESFTADLLSLLTGDFTQPEIEYYVNEKAGPVSPKITDTGATTLDETINSTFVETVSSVAVKAIDEATDGASEGLSDARSHAVAETDEAISALADVREALEQAAGGIGAARTAAADSRTALEDVRASLGAAASSLADLASTAAAAQTALSEFADSAGPLAHDALAALEGVSDQIGSAESSIESAFSEAQESARAALAKAQAAQSECAALAAHLRTVADALAEDDPIRAPLDTAAAALEEHAAAMQQRIDALSALADAASSAGSTAAGAASGAHDAVQGAITSAQEFSQTLFGEALPAASARIGELASTASSLVGAVATQQTLVDEAFALTGELDGTLDALEQALEGTDGIVAGIEEDLNTMRTDAQAISSSSTLAALFGESGLDAQTVASFIGAPTEVETEKLYPMEAYGQGMAPLFMNLTFWIGAFMLLVIMRQEVDDEGVPAITLGERYLSRFALFALLAVAQALICCAGVLAIGVTAANIPALFLAAAVASLAYLSIIYALSATLQHIGKGLAIVLVFAQIPGATGLYPIELTSSFFQAISPALPFTYGIGALREAIFGFYGTKFATDLAALAAFFVFALAFGLIVGPLMANVNRLVARQIGEGGIYHGEAVEIPARPYRISQLFRALAEKESYRAELTARYERFERRYPLLMRGAVIAGVIVPVAFALVFALTPTEKVVILTAWLVWMVAAFVFVIVVESLRASISRQMALESMSDERLIGLGSARAGVERTDGEAPEEPRGGEGRG